MNENEEFEFRARAEAESNQARASDADIEASRPKSIGEIAWSGARNVLSGGAKGLTNLVAGVGGLVSKGLDKAGVTRHLEDRARETGEDMNWQIDKALGTENPGPGGILAQGIGEVGTGLAIPIERAVPAVTRGLASLNLPPYLASLGAKAAVNTGYGAVQGEGVGHPIAGAVAGAAGTGLAEVANKLGGQIIKSYIKGGHKGAAEGLDIPWFLRQEMGGSGSKMAQNVDTRLEGLRQAQSDIIQQKGNLPTPVLQALQNVENKINTSPSIAKNLGSLPAARAQLKDYADDLIPIVDQQTGEAPLQMAWEMKKKAQSDAAALYRAHNSGNDTKGQVKQGVSAMFATELGDLMEKQAPELTELNPEFSKLIPVAKALSRRNIIAKQHNPIGLDELAAVESGVNFLVHGQPLGLTLPIASRLSKMPSFGQLVRDASRKSGRLVSLAPAARDVTNLITGRRGQE